MESFPDFVQLRCDKLLHFNRVVSAFRKEFGTDRVFVLLHEDLVDRPFEAIIELLEFMGCDPRIAENVESRRVKPSAPDLTLRLLRLRNLALASVGGFLPDRWVRKMYWWGLPGSGILEALVGRSSLWRLATDAIRPVLCQSFADGNAALFDMIGKDITAYDYPQPGRAGKA